jgi:hypothetical protein
MPWAAVHTGSVLSDTAALAVLQPARVERWQADVRESKEWRRAADAAILAAGRELVRALHRVEVPLLAGSDAPNPLVIPGYSLQRELEVLVSPSVSLR